MHVILDVFLRYSPLWKWKTGCTNYTTEIRDCEKWCWQCCVFISSIYLFIYVFLYLFVYLLKLDRDKAQHAAEMVELEKKIAELKDQLHKARHGLQDEVGFLKSLSARKLCHNAWMTVMTSFNFIFNRFPGLMPIPAILYDKRKGTVSMPRNSLNFGRHRTNTQPLPTPQIQSWICVCTIFPACPHCMGEWRGNCEAFV